jgi:hypothetical protein
MPIINYFPVAPQRDGVPVLSVIDQTNLIALTNTDSYFNDITKVFRVDVVYSHQDGRERKKILHLFDGTNLQGSVSWSPFSKPGVWSKVAVVMKDTDGALHYVSRSEIGSGQDLILS